jgi:GNAT superfamily N-acetyltransferase
MTESRTPDSPNASVGRLLRPEDAQSLAELFGAIDSTRFHPHPLNSLEAERIAAYVGEDAYAILEDSGLFVAYGILRGWEDGFVVPSLGIAVRMDRQRHGYGRQMMNWLAIEARRRGANRIRLRVDPQNLGARRLYESLGYTYAGDERGELVMFLDLVT